jgi:ribosome-binding factor A
MKKEKSLKIKQTESLLKELLPEALSSLSDSRINSLSVTNVDCSKGKYNATVYLGLEFFTDSEKREILKQLNYAKGPLKSYCLNATSWFRCPDFIFKFDNELDKINRLESIFEKIKAKDE